MAKRKLTKGIARSQNNQVNIENFEAAVKVLLTHEQGIHPVKPTVVAAARRQKAICYEVLRSRGFSSDELNYVPELGPDEVDPEVDPVVAPAEDLSEAITRELPKPDQPVTLERRRPGLRIVGAEETNANSNQHQ